MPPRQKTPVAIFPFFRFIYDGFLLNIDHAKTAQPPDVHLDKGSVLWSGDWQEGTISGLWTMEQRMIPHSPNIAFTVGASDSAGSLYVEKFVWLPGANPWGHPFGIELEQTGIVSYSGFFESGGYYNAFPRTYHQEL